MRKMSLAMQISLDGYAAGPNDEMDWLPPFNDELSWKSAHEEMWSNLSTVDTMVLGRKTYQIWESYWPAVGMNPKSNDSDRRFSRLAEETDKVVLSNTLNEAKWKNTRLIGGNVKEELQKLKEGSGKDIAVVGGAGMARSVIGTGLIDEYMITVHPVLLGKGKPLFGDLVNPYRLKLVRTRDLGAGSVLLHYLYSRGASASTM
ncbi:MAG: dihydrofolate reductase [Methanomassiliicoccus sp.]|nr:dihydrofolate reductase [Methanomassiliicoccus sp.]